VQKRSEGKPTFPGRKQVWRVSDDGTAARDVIALEDEPGPRGATPLLEQVVRGGTRIAPAIPLAEVRRYCAEMVAALPSPLRRLADSPEYPAIRSDRLQRLA
jgi:nicotinate phosphoribosyltransferase